jgi:zinc transporter 7
MEQQLFSSSSVTIATAAFLSTGIISLVPNVIFLLLPGYAAGEGGTSKFLSLGQAMAAGGLLGDVFLHTLQESSSDGDSNASASQPGIWILLGFVLFFGADLIIRTADDGHHHHTDTNQTVKENGQRIETHRPQVNQSTIFLNLAADALHNFTDGLAIGATYSLQSNKPDVSLSSLLSSRGGLATLAILFHEVPHELGDFCTLVKAGYSKSQAVMAQFATAVAAFAGTAVTFLVSSSSEDSWAQEWLLFITAGG